MGVLLLSALQAAEPLRVMTFNVRYPSPEDGRNLWNLRRDLLVSTIRDQKPDLIGAQELFKIQGDYIVKALPEYEWFGVSRRGNHEDEHMGVFYRKSRLELLQSGSFWLSETPEKPGSSSWNMSLPRMVTWGEFRDQESGRRFYLYNTHFPHRKEDETARTHCARVIAERLHTLPADATVILTGDFNTGMSSEAHRVLTQSLTDVWQATPNHPGPTGTFHNFTGKPAEERIDWILYRGVVTPSSIETITTNDGGRYPSDHFPVVAAFGWK